MLTIHEMGKAGQLVTDEDILAFACADSRAVLTFNRKHFVRLHGTQPEHAGIIACRFDPDFPRRAGPLGWSEASAVSLNGNQSDSQRRSISS